MRILNGIMAPALFLILLLPVSQVSAEVANPELCDPLIQAIKDKRNYVAQKAVAESSAITGAGDLQDMACMSSLLGIKFNFFEGLPSMASILTSLKQAVMDALDDAVCHYSNNIQQEVSDFLSCTASVKLDVSAAMGTGFDLQQCLGTNNSFDFSASRSVGGGGQRVFDAGTSRNFSVVPDTPPKAGVNASRPTDAAASNLDRLFN